MIAVVFSGSRFSDWRLADKGKIVTGFRTMGMNPYLHDERFIFQLLNKNNTLINYAEQIRRIYFFGAGSSSAERKEKIATVFKTFFKNAKVAVDHDVNASARATFGDGKGLIGILGSGSNAAYYNGKKTVENNFGLGYILADEGSANWIGRMLLKSFLNETMPEDLREKFTDRYSLDRKVILDKVYNQANPTLFLTSFADFVTENHQHRFVKKIIQKGFKQYIETYLLPLTKQYPEVTVNFTGSVAAGYEEWLRETAAEYGIEIGIIVREPIHNLLKYYINKN
jgi:Predicted N-acetylglucosamine kinase